MSSSQLNNTGSSQSSPTTSDQSLKNSLNDTITRDFSLISLASSTGLDPDLFKNEQHANLTLKKMLSSLENRELCDVVLISSTDGKRIPAHRLVLTASSPYFSAMFNSSLREANEREVTLHDINSEALELLINYCYTGTVELKEETVETLLATATLLQMTPVVSACSSFLARQLHPSNCIGFALFAELQNCDTLHKLSTSYICQHFMQVVKNQEFFLLDSDQLANLLKNNDLNVASEQDVFHALMSWVHHDEENRKKYIPKLLGLIKLPLLQPAFIVDHVEKLCDDKDCMKLVMEAMKYHLLPERYQATSTERSRPRKSTMGTLMAVGGMDAHKGCITIETYNPRLDKWSLTKNMPTRRLQFGVALMDDKLIIVGGRDGLKTLNTVDLVDLQTMTWTSLNSMGTPRHGLGVAVLEGPLYAIGGHDGWSYLNTAERFDPVSKTWTYIAPMCTMRSTAGVAVLNGRLYVCGGRDGTVCHRSVECYDPHTNRWSLRSPMNKRRGGVAVCALNGFLYALGGHDCPASNPAVCRTETVERYCPSTDTWTIIANLSSGRDAIGCSILGNSIVAVGGYDGIQYLKICERYDPERNEWNQLSQVAYSRAGSCIITIPNNLENNCNSLTSVPTTSTTV